METSDKIWQGKRVFVKLKSFLNRCYVGSVLAEDNFSITIRDKVGQLVRLNFDELALLQEEK
jgi:hypothetical protein